MTTHFLVVLALTAAVSTALIFILIHNYRRFKKSDRSTKGIKMRRQPKLGISHLSDDIYPRGPLTI